MDSAVTARPSGVRSQGRTSTPPSVNELANAGQAAQVQTGRVSDVATAQFGATFVGLWGQNWTTVTDANAELGQRVTEGVNGINQVLGASPLLSFLTLKQHLGEAPPSPGSLPPCESPVICRERPGEVAVALGRGDNLTARPLN